MKNLVMVFLLIFIIISCGDETIISEIDDTKPKVIETLPLPSQNGLTINSAGNIVKSDNYKFKFVVGMNQTVNSKKNIETKKYSFKFTTKNNVDKSNVDKNSNTKYRFTLIK